MPKPLAWSEPRGAALCILKLRQLDHPHPVGRESPLAPRSGRRFFAGTWIAIHLYSCLISLAVTVRSDVFPPLKTGSHSASAPEESPSRLYLNVPMSASIVRIGI